MKLLVVSCQSSSGSFLWRSLPTNGVCKYAERELPPEPAKRAWSFSPRRSRGEESNGRYFEPRRGGVRFDLVKMPDAAPAGLGGFLGGAGVPRLRRGLNDHAHFTGWGLATNATWAGRAWSLDTPPLGYPENEDRVTNFQGLGTDD